VFKGGIRSIERRLYNVISCMVTYRLAMYIASSLINIPVEQVIHVLQTSIIVKYNCVDNVSGSYFVGYIVQLQCCS